jgi:hypothetical protein
MESLDTSTKTVSMRWSAAAAAEEFRQQQNKQHTPMYQNRSPPLYDEKTIEYQMHDLLIIDDNEIFSDDEDDEVYDVYDEPITMTNQDTSHFDTVSSSVSHIQYINSIRKDRPLPKIPEIPQRISSMPVPCTEGYGYNNGTKVSAQQVFQMLSREPPKEEWVGGVYAFKTEVDVNTKESDHSNFDAIENNTPRSRPVSDVPSLSSGGGTSSFEIQATSHQDYDTLNRISLLYTDDDPSSYHRNSFDHAPLVSNNSDSDFTKDVESYQSAIFPPIETHRPKLKKVQSSNSISHPGTMTSFSLTHDKESLKTYRRMASKTNNRQVQMTFAKYLLQLVSNHTSGETRDRLQEEAEYWIGRLSKSNHPEALYIKGHWHAGKDESRKLMGSEYKKKNMNRAFKCFQQAAKFGSVEAHYELAEYWKERLEFKKAMSNYRFAASKNHILALYVKYSISLFICLFTIS